MCIFIVFVCICVCVCSYLVLRPLPRDSELLLGVRFCVSVEARAEDEYESPRPTVKSRPSWKSLFLMAS